MASRLEARLRKLEIASGGDDILAELSFDQLEATLAYAEATIEAIQSGGGEVTVTDAMLATRRMTRPAYEAAIAGVTQDWRDRCLARALSDQTERRAGPDGRAQAQGDRRRVRGLSGAARLGRRLHLARAGG